MTDETHIPGTVYFKQGGAELVVSAGAKITIEDGGILQLVTSGSFTGYNGVTGPQGATGADGATGPAGPTGPAA